MDQNMHHVVMFIYTYSKTQTKGLAQSDIDFRTSLPHGDDTVLSIVLSSFPPEGRGQGSGSVSGRSCKSVQRKGYSLLGSHRGAQIPNACFPMDGMFLCKGTGCESQPGVKRKAGKPLAADDTLLQELARRRVSSLDHPNLTSHKSLHWGSPESHKNRSRLE
ncbi:hypothetical protein Mapa_006754 [Marchantia paleacea]|nr:hypothetical protein Mapa_006754 [Marchantia paleacea]